MGWDFTKTAKKQDIVNQLIKPWMTKDTKHETVAHKVVGKTLWTVSKRNTDTYIGCFLLDNKPGFGWGYKDLYEAMHPYQYDCPLDFLAMTPVACQEWRDNVLAFHAKNNNAEPLDTDDTKLMRKEYEQMRD